MYDVIIVGAGLGGLTSAVYLAKAGFPVTIIEQHNSPGGYATAFRRGEYSFDVSLHTFNLPPDIYQELGLDERLERIKIKKFLRVITPNKDLLLPDANPEAYLDLMCSNFPHEKEGIKSYLNDCFTIFDEMIRISRKADDLLGDLLTDRSASSFEKLNALSPPVLANLLLGEHPQTIALVLVNMKYHIAAEIIQELPEDLQSEVMVRIADLQNVPNEIVSEIQEVIEEQVSSVSKESDENLGGIQTAAEILNNLDSNTENAILDKIEAGREELAEEIRQSMFIFEDLIQLDDRSIRTLLKEISNDELTLALKTASEELGEKIFGNVSQRAAQMMKEDIEVMGPVKLRDVEQAQLNIIKIARRLADEGKVVLGGKGGEDVLV